MAVPKRKTSHARKMKRRSSVWKLETPTNLVKCPQCGGAIMKKRPYRGKGPIKYVCYNENCKFEELMSKSKLK